MILHLELGNVDYFVLKSIQYLYIGNTALLETLV